MNTDKSTHTKGSWLSPLGAFVGILLVVLGSCVPTSPQWKEDRTITFSPDDRAIAYRHRGAIYVARTQGDKHRRIYRVSEDEPISSPRWAPDQRGLAFAVADELPESETAPVAYGLWFWPAPENIWESSQKKSASGGAPQLPVDWSPADPVRLTSARARAAVQIQGGALCEWHPDGRRIVCLDTDRKGRQHIVEVAIANGRKKQVSPVEATSLAFKLSPDGKRIVCAADDREKSRSGLWLGPLTDDPRKWKRIDSSPGPRIVPSLEIVAKTKSRKPLYLYDLRPRLGAWSPDSRYLAYFRLTNAKRKVQGAKGSATASEPKSAACALVVIPMEKGEPQILPLPEGTPSDLYWSAALRVERFVGWSAEGKHIAYLTPQTGFAEAFMPLPDGNRVTWGPVARHNLVIAQGNGTLAESRFSGMNVDFARWANKKQKLSFWATYLPTVNLLPPGDPAAVLDVEENSLKWYPTNLAEYAQVGHYYLLNNQYETASERYSEALEKLEDREDELPLKAQISLWRGICRLALHKNAGGASDLAFFREHFALENREPPRTRGGETTLSKETARDLAADRIIFSTMLSMNQVALAQKEAEKLAAKDRGPRGLQAQCFLALIDQAISDINRFATRVAGEILPNALAPTQHKDIQAAVMVRRAIRLLLLDANLQRMDAGTKKRAAGILLKLAQSVRENQPKMAGWLASSAGVLYRELGDMESETKALRISRRTLDR